MGLCNLEAHRIIACVEENKFLAIDVIEEADLEIIERFFDGDRDLYALSTQTYDDWWRILEVCKIDLQV